MPQISVIVPNYNHATFLRQRLESILNQTFQDIELIILDDCSSDNSREIIEGYRGHPKVIHIEYNKQNSGSPFRQWKKGIGYARGSWIWIAESDDWSDPLFLERIFKEIKTTQSDIGYCRSLFCFEDERKNRKDDSYIFLDRNRWEESYANDGDREVRNYLLYKNTITNASSVLFRKEVSGMPFDEIMSMKYCGDWFFWSVYLRGKKICYVPETLNFFRCHDKSTREESGLKENFKRIEEISFVIKSIKRYYHLRFSHLIRLGNYRWLRVRLNEIAIRNGVEDVKKAMRILPKEIRFFLNMAGVTHLN